MSVVARKIQVVNSYADALRYQRLNQRVLREVAQDEQLVKDAAATVGVSEGAVVHAIRSVGADLAAKGLNGLVSRQQLQTKILEAIVKHSRYHDMMDQTWAKLIQKDGRIH